jgi:hypothetical protein
MDNSNIKIMSELTFDLVRSERIGNTVISFIKVGDDIVCKAIENALKLIKVGKYRLSIYMSPHNKLVFLLHNVVGHAGIEIHVANYYYQLKGCIAPCEYTSGAMGCNSRNSLDKLFKIAMHHDVLYINITDQPLLASQKLVSSVLL